MSLNLHKLYTQQPLQLEDDAFLETPMQFDNPADNNGYPSTPTRPTPPTMQPTICISEQTIRKMCKNLQLLSPIIRASDHNCICESLDMVFFAVSHALQEDSNLKAHLADKG